MATVVVVVGAVVVGGVVVGGGSVVEGLGGAVVVGGVVWVVVVGPGSAAVKVVVLMMLPDVGVPDETDEGGESGAATDSTSANGSPVRDELDTGASVPHADNNSTRHPTTAVLPKRILGCLCFIPCYRRHLYLFDPTSDKTFRIPKPPTN